MADELDLDEAAAQAAADEMFEMYQAALAGANPMWDAEAAVRQLARGTRVVDAADLTFLPDPEFLIDGVLETDSLAFLYGAAGSHKSFYAIHIALELALAGSKVVYIAAEGFGGLKIRFEAWAEAFNGGVIPRGVTVFRAHGTLAQQSDLMLDAYGYVAEDRPVLIVVDTLARTIEGDENSAKDASAYINTCNTLREASPGCTLVMVHHSGHDDSRMRGSSAFKAASDTVLRMTSDTLQVERSKNFDTDESLTYHHRVMGKSLVLDFVTAEDMALGAESAEEAARNVFTWTIANHLRENPGALGSELLGLVPGRRQTKIDRLHEMIEAGTVRTEQGSGRSIHHYLTEVPA